MELRLLLFSWDWEWEFGGAACGGIWGLGVPAGIWGWGPWGHIWGHLGTRERPELWMENGALGGFWGPHSHRVTLGTAGQGHPSPGHPTGVFGVTGAPQPHSAAGHAWIPLDFGIWGCFVLIVPKIPSGQDKVGFGVSRHHPVPPHAQLPPKNRTEGFKSAFPEVEKTQTLLPKNLPKTGGGKKTQSLEL